MKQGWEIKKLGEVCDIINGRNQKKVENPNGKYPIYGSGGIMGYADDFLCRAGTTIIGRKGSINKPLYVDADFWNVDTAFGIQPKCCVDRFIYYLCKSIDFTLYDKGVTIPSLVKSDLLQIPIPVPERAEQERIVGELDCLSGIIANKRAQLRELDTLAQSIFYTMFGDPITNDKCWQTDVLENVAPQKGYKGVVPSIEEKYWVLNLDMVESNTGEILQKCYFDKESIGSSTNMFDMNNILYSKLRPYLNKVVIPYDIGYATSELVPLCPNKNLLNRIFFAHILRSRFFVNYISAKVAGAKMPRVSMDVFKKFHVILPSLCLQNEFAEKIENIERQKELITKSIKETEDLFNSRMSYYFD